MVSKRKGRSSRLLRRFDTMLPPATNMNAPQALRGLAAPLP
jgi:hypothetical protein